ncbi:gliding motility-associated C-terminal domain-containing protein [Taibaiella chishuiensis]|uniref:Gliding motility-associated-like protein n=1 Tax=Taibaiella chishuiensis TaxID=1434707 RepID=A0A2P8DD05_9BACT|nr:gliding motility-associated C-terminal domain-containing protein [Taibaiella chishuiensis]PSK95089.1 gliding motility-associated-like protein [Taibaiella chishuiensis]
MKRLFTSGIILILILFARLSQAQGENNIWCFGDSLGLNFNTTPPSFFRHSMVTTEGCASVCDPAGNLLFYSSGFNNWDRNNNLMPNGTGMLGNGPIWGGIHMGSSATGVAIARSPANPQQYYVITTDAYEDSTHNAYYSVIDMTLNGGLGDVVPGQKNIVLATNVSEGVVVQKAGECGNYWIILHDGNSPQHLSFKLTAPGISTTPVTSNAIPVPASRMTFNKEATLAVSGGTAMHLLSFDKTTGLFASLGQLSAAPMGSAGAVFSPDGSKLYAGINNLLQYDLSLLPNLTAVQSSRIVIDTGMFMHLRKGPDDKIYTLRIWAKRVGCISNPDAAGSACLYNRDALTSALFPSATFSDFGNIVVVHEPRDTIATAIIDTTICQLPQVTLNAPAVHESYLWNTGGTGVQHTVNNDGIYWVYGRDGCRLSIDSFRVRFIRFNTGLGNDTAVCKGYQLVPSPVVAGATYRWQDGSTASAFNVSQKGSYSLTTTLEGCSVTDSIAIDVIIPTFHLYENDTLVCAGTTLQLHAEIVPEGNYLWSNGSTEATIFTDGPGTYTVTAANACGAFSDSVHLATMYCNCRPFVPNAFSPNGDGHNDVFIIELHCPAAKAYSHAIYNRYGQKVFESKTPGIFWDGAFNGVACDAGTYFYTIEYKINEEKFSKKGDLVLIR